MPRHENKKTVPYNINRVYAVVGDVVRYPEFLPWCAAVRVLSGSTDAAAGGEAIVELAVRYGMMHESYVSRVTFVPPDGGVAKVSAVLERGPFAHLINDWSMKAIDENSTELAFLVDFELKNKMLSALIGGAFSKAVLAMTKAFEDRLASVK